MTDTAAATTDLTLAELVRARPALTGMFDRLGLDFCCGADRTPGEASAASGVAVIDALAALDAAAATDSQSPGDSWTVLGPAELAGRHQRLRRSHGRRRRQHPLGAGQGRPRLDVSRYRVEVRPPALRALRVPDQLHDRRRRARHSSRHHRAP